MPKSERPKEEKRRNWNFRAFRFQEALPISDVRALMNMPKLSENLTFGFRTFFFQFGLLRPNCPKSKQFGSVFGHIWFGLGLKSPNQTFCLKTECSSHLPLWKFRLEYGRCPNTEPSGTGTKYERPRTEFVRISDVDCIYFFVYI